MKGMILEIQCLSPHNFFLNMNLHENLVIMELAHRSITISLIFHHKEVSYLQNIFEMFHRRNVCYRKKFCVYFLIFIMRTIPYRKK